MWRQVHEADLNSTLSQTEIDAFRKSAAEGDPVESLISTTVAYVRGIIRSAPQRVKLHPNEAYLPESLIVPAMDLARFNVLTRLNVVVNESRTKAYERANQLFDDVRAGKFVPESDNTADTSGDVAGSPKSGAIRPHRLLD